MICVACLQVPVPDVSPDDAPSEGLLSMSAGDFVEVYGRQMYAGAFDCVATCFFLDCAHNIVDLIQVIYHVLKVGSSLQSESSGILKDPLTQLCGVSRH